MSTLAIDGSGPVSGGARAAYLARLADLALLAVALPVFIVAGWPLAGYAVAAGAWLGQRAIQSVATRAARRAIAAGDRRHAFGAVATSSVGRLWILTAPILVAGIIEREVGLAGAVLAAVLVTAHLAGQGLAHWLTPEEAA